ncbi:MAG: SigB/SigF/SigG family RNA polymerase sigma factor [Lachnospiraceae bacterium]|nr:SigB/SigF/SigG family RNA polymerase sigma factor [Lachnospiraceae bacterium]MCD7765097.1 SigB/SigF/SigG family RNA polymerase sigma factor [Lachnospiraceae bacterium]
MEQTLALIRKAHEGDKEARTQLAEENIGLVYTVVRRFTGRGCEYEDLVQIGSIGLLKAIDNFDSSFDVRFSTYAVPMIAGEIRRFLRDDGMIRVGRLLKETAVRAMRAREELEQDGQTEPAMEELALAVGVSPEELVMALEACSDVESLNQTVYQGDGTPVLLEDRLPDERDHHEILLDHMLLDQLLKALAPDERRLIRMRYFEDMTQVQTAACLGMTQVQVSRAEKRILRRMREAAVCKDTGQH